MPNCMTIVERSKYSTILKVNYTYISINFYPCIHLFHVELLKFSAEISSYTCLFLWGFFLSYEKGMKIIQRFRW